MKYSYLRLHIGILLAGATGLFGKIITISELPLVFYRVLFSAILLALVMALQHRLHRLPWRQVALMMGCGLLLSTHWVCYYGSIKMSNVSIGAVCFALVGFFTAIIEPIIDRHRPSWRELLLSLITVCGILLIFGFDTRYRLGIAVGCLSSLLYALFSVLSKCVQASTGRASSTMLLYELTGGGMLLAVATLVYSACEPQAVVVPPRHDLIALIIFAAVFITSSPSTPSRWPCCSLARPESSVLRSGAALPSSCSRWACRRLWPLEISTRRRASHAFVPNWPFIGPIIP